MLTSDTRLWSSAKSRRRLDHRGEVEPVIVQIAGANPAMVAQAARAAVARGAQIVDINMGCPAKKVCKRKAGSALLRDTDLVARILTAAVAAVAVPVTLKIRTGWAPDQRNGVQIARLAEEAGIQALAVHGRTRACRFRGHAEYETIGKIKQAVSIPVIANGDIDSPAKAVRVLEYTGADGVMIGRAAQGRPWLFREIVHRLQSGRDLAAPTTTEVRDIMLAHLEDLYSYYGERCGVRVARKHLSWYCRGRPETEPLRYHLVRAEQAAEQLRLANMILDQAPAEGLAA
jgi:tRNA-dihydrouridine synthase B